MSLRRLARLALALAVIGVVSSCDRSSGGGSDEGPVAHGDAGRSSGTGIANIRLKLPEFRFEDQLGRPCGLAELKGKVWIADFIFVRCGGPCPEMTESMKAIQNETTDLSDLHLVTVTVTPQHDSREDLYEYAERYGANHERWHFLRGGRDETHSLITRGFKEGDVSEPANHSTKFLLVDRDGFLRGSFDGRDQETRKLLLDRARELLATD